MFSALYYLRTMPWLKSTWFITLIGFLAISFLIWFGGPLLSIAEVSPLASTKVRLAVIVTLLLLFLVAKVWTYSRRKKQENQAVDSLLSGEDQGNFDQESAHEIETLKDRIISALDVLKRSNLAKGNGLYHLPWYILIGPPGTGKTTLLQNSGLDFPLEDKLGSDPLSGIGGTRYCDWWFTNKAVLIDTAGRYTTQDSHSKKDAGAWLGFLGLLKKYRTRRPINGVVVTISLASLIKQTRTERNLHARAIKVRIQELKNQLGMQFPVYVMLTKADLIAGFNEYFSDMDSKDREQVWGATFPVIADDDSTGVVGQFNKEFHSLLKRIQARLNKRLAQERDIDRRTLIQQFPQQMRSLQPIIDDFLKESFSPNAYEESLMLRGVYIVSATQDGQPIDSVFANVSTGLKLGHVPLHSHSGEAKSYFIKDLLEEIIFPEQYIGSVNRHHQQHTLWVRRGITAACTLGLVVCSALWHQSYVWNKQLVLQSEKAVADFQQIAPSGLSSDTDIYLLVQSLNALKAFPVAKESALLEQDQYRMGLYQGDKLGQPAQVAYQMALQGYFSQFLTSALEAEIAHNREYLEYLYESLKTYLMLYEVEHRDLEQVYGWFELYFENQFPGAINESMRHDLMRHTKSLFEYELPFNRQNNQVVAQARQSLTDIPLAQRAYQRLKIEFTSSYVANFKLEDVLGAQGRSIISHPEGSSLAIPGLYTYNGYYSIFKVENARIVKRLMEDSWVYGDRLSIDEDSEKDVMRLVEAQYFDDYIEHWRAFIDEIAIKSYASAKDGEMVIGGLISHEQPISELIVAMQKELRLTQTPTSNPDLLDKAADIAKKTNKDRINRFLPNKGDLTSEFMPESEVELAFAPLLAISSADLEEVQLTLQKLRDYLGLLSESDNKQAYVSLISDAEQIDLSNSLKRGQKILPSPFSGWMSDLATQTSSIAKQGAQVHLSAIWQDSVYKEYKRTIRGKYPFNRNTNREVRLKDFSRFFGYGGTMDKFFNDYLKSSVDTSKKRWTLDRAVGINPQSLKVFKHARRIRDTYFIPGTQTPKVAFSLKPMFLDAHISNFRFEMGEQQMAYRHGPQRSTHFVWPTDSGDSEVRLSFVPPKSGYSISESYAGDWGLFRLLDRVAEDRPSSIKDNVLEIAVKGNTAMLKLQPESSNNPFWARDLTRFSCAPTL
ncbi:type VI secretion system membrane subunit TssM [Vibrio sp. SCSIO 43136]|uniref:type VI secretion system membrane subunit TssM n=1 Tax=Vibrio sp. SCSIO 43136 TaxID=2819101 RepID=UPI002075011F|nr:type VI secretion system membrane subunit TssM [Vibrio sp. SCSIO 43136]USD67507.1 type VI secretion system membrane subunit TssM [Vibrio sp. SCSIO 43136]